MGEEILSSQFTDADYETYYHKLDQETEVLRSMFDNQQFNQSSAMCGIEQEAWITNKTHYPMPENQYLLDQMQSDLLSPELALFNIELNTTPQHLASQGLSNMHRELSSLWQECEEKLQQKKLLLHMVGILPTVRDDELILENMSRMNRYQALNEQVLKSRKGKPLKLNIVGKEHLKSEHLDVMLESAATSFQIHRQVPAELSARYYNAAILISGFMVALSANSPFLFGRQLWDETRIPLFEQAVEVGGYGDAAHGPIRRVTFGSDYAKNSVFECFEENLAHYPVLLPVALKEKDNRLPHLRMHNGTIWRWNRPLIGFDENDNPHVRIEHRVVSAGPTVTDEIANAVFFYGLQEYFASLPEAPEISLTFSDSKNNFYAAAQHGLNTTIRWLDGKKHPITSLLSTELVKNACEGLAMLEVDRNVIKEYMEIVEARIAKKQTGAEWQKAIVNKYGKDMEQLAAKYWELQKTGNPVHDWSIT